MPAYFVWYQRFNNRIPFGLPTSVTPLKPLIYMKGVYAKSEDMIFLHASRLSENGFKVKIVAVREMSTDQEIVFGERMLFMV